MAGARRLWLQLALLSAVVAACGAAGSGPTLPAVQAQDAAAGDSGGDEVADTGPEAANAEGETAGETAGDTGSRRRSGPKATPWGPISGDCGNLGPALSASEPSFWVNTWHFDSPGPFDPAPLRSGASQRYSGPNAGGSSKCSEVMSMQLLYECEGAITLKPEVEIAYDRVGAITDWLASFGGKKIGVSVTRAYKGPSVDVFSAADANTLLTKKLTGVLQSTANVAAADKWDKQIVHIWTQHPEWVAVLRDAWQSLDAATRADTLVLVTVEEGSTDITADTCQ